MRSHIAFHAWKPRSYQFITAVLLILFYTPCLSEDGTPSQLSELLEMDINELMDLKVTLPSRNEERQFDSAAAVYVLTQEVVE